MSCVKKFEKVLRHPIGAIIVLSGYEKFKLIPDKKYLKIMYEFYMNEKLDLRNPKTFNEKLQWLKLYDRKPEYTIMVDKYKVRDYIKEKIGEEYLIPLIGVWDNPDDIDFKALPNQFVLKCNHNSGLGMYICKDKSKLTPKDIETIQKNLAKGLAQDYYFLGREWPYKDVPRKIICEKYMEDKRTSESCDCNAGELSDYKVLCFDGEPKLIELHHGRFTGHHTQDFYDVNWNRTKINQVGEESAPEVAQKPTCFDEMLRLSRILSEGIPHVRVDWYIVDGKLYFSELTFYDASGFDPFQDKADGLMLGSWITVI